MALTIRNKKSLILDTPVSGKALRLKQQQQLAHSFYRLGSSVKYKRLLLQGKIRNSTTMLYNIRHSFLLEACHIMLV